MRLLYSLLATVVWLTAPTWLWAAANPRLTLPEFAQLADKASDSVTISLDAALLGMASKFLDGKDPEDAAVKDAIKGLQGIYIRSYTFDEDFVYRPADIDGVVKQLSAPGWTRLVQTRSRKTHANVDIYIMLVDNKATGLAVIASEPREFTIVNIIGSIDLDKLHRLEGHFGVPNLDIDSSKPGEPTKPVKPQAK
jgi:hypothetical protein